MKRHNYKRDLWKLMADYRREPFAWGVHDCATFAARVIECVTGSPPQMQVFWKDEADARVVIADAGGLRPLVEAHLGPAVAWGQCGCGDIVLYQTPEGDALAVHDGTQLIGPSAHGLRKIPFEFAVCGWQI